MARAEEAVAVASQLKVLEAGKLGMRSVRTSASGGRLLCPLRSQAALRRRDAEPGWEAALPRSFARASTWIY